MRVLFLLTPEMPANEIAARVRATQYEQWAPTMTLHGITYEIRPVSDHTVQHK